MKLALHIAFGAMAIALVLPSLAHADLFANLPAMGEVRQLQTDGTPVASYPYLELDISSQPPLASLSRLGDWNYLSVTLGGQLVFHLFNSTTDEFFPSIYVDLLAVVPTPDPPGPVTGMALRQLEDHLEIVLATRPRLNEGPGYVSRVQVPTTEPGMPFDSFSLIAESPPVALPEGFFPNGADLDPLTGEMWVVGNLGAPQGGNVQILRLGSDLEVLGSITPELPLSSLIFSLGFDGSRLFLGGLDLAEPGPVIYEFDRHDGSLLQTLPIPGAGVVSGLAGSSTIPEPTTMSVLAILVAICSSHRRRRRGRRHLP